MANNEILKALRQYIFSTLCEKNHNLDKFSSTPINFPIKIPNKLFIIIEFLNYKLFY
jgi:hypothetical protein